MEDQSLQQLKRTRRKGWVGLIFFGAIAAAGAIEGEWIMLIGGGLMTVGSIAALIIVGRQLKDLPLYRPGKGFWYYRMTRRRKLLYLSGTQALVVVLLFVFYWLGMFNIISAIFGIVGLTYIQFLVKPRIKLHTPVDDASLFELEELGIIDPDETVNGLYKDFASWDDVHEGAKILVLTPDSLIVIRMTDPEEGERTDIRLRDINRLGILTAGRQGQGLIATIGLTDGLTIRFLLYGNSFQDSPEQFVQQFLETLDRLHLGQASDRGPTAALRTRAEALPQTPSGRPSAPAFRRIDLHDGAAVPADEAPGGRPRPDGRRVLDF